MEASSEILIIAEAFPERNAPLHGGPPGGRPSGGSDVREMTAV